MTLPTTEIQTLNSHFLALMQQVVKIDVSDAARTFQISEAVCRRIAALSSEELGHLAKMDAPLFSCHIDHIAIDFATATIAPAVREAMVQLRYKLGERFPRPVDGSRLMFQPSGIEIVFVVPAPTEEEVRSFTHGTHIKIGFARWHRIGILLVEFSDGFSFEVPFDAGIEDPDQVPLYNPVTANDRIPVRLIAVDSARCNIIFGMHYITVSPRVSKLLARQIRAQWSEPLDMAAYNAAIAKMYAEFPKTGSLRAMALANDKAGI